MQKQLNRHRPHEGLIGDCHRTAIASLLDMDAKDVPNFGEVGFKIDDPSGGNKAEFDAAVEAWLNEKGYTQIQVAFADSLESVQNFMKVINPGILYLLGGESKTGVNHTVVGLNEVIILDPSIDNAGIVGPTHPDGHYWITVLVPLSQKVLP